MKNFYKAIMMLTMAVGLFLIVPTPLEVMAKTVSSVNASASSNKITVSGKAEAGTVACAILVYDESGKTLQAMETCAVDGKNTYSYTLSQEFAAGTYLVKVADYEGGDFCTGTVTVEKAGSDDGDDTGDDKPDDNDKPGSGDGNNTGNGTGNGTNASSGSQSSSSGEEEKVIVPIEYIVVKGDTLGKIARRNNMTLSALLALNPQIKNPDLIYPGQKIILGYTETTGVSEETDVDAEYYIVQRGDFLYKIARKNKLTLAQLATLNPEIMRQKYIYAGQKIRIK